MSSWWQSRPVAITGLGVVGSTGCGVPALRTALEQGDTVFRHIEHDPRYHRRGASRWAATVDPAELGQWLAPLAARRMSPPSRYAVVAAKMALEQAGLQPGCEQLGNAAVIFATSYGPSSFTERLLDQIITESPTAASPMLFTESVANAPAAQVALAVSATGANLTLTQREAGALQAVARAAREVALGRSQIALAGGVEELNPLLHSVLDRFGALAANAPRPLARPFDRRRDGFVAGEGATVLVMERESSARQRGAAPLARFSLAGSAFDPSAPVTGWGRGSAALAASVRSTLERGGWRTDTIDRWVAGASGSRQGDRLEGDLINELYAGESRPAILAPKAVTGEVAPGQLAAAVLAAVGARFGPTPGFEQVDPRIGFAPHDGRELAAAERVLAVAPAAGGACSWLGLERAP